MTPLAWRCAGEPGSGRIGDLDQDQFARGLTGQVLLDHIASL